MRDGDPGSSCLNRRMFHPPDEPEQRAHNNTMHVDIAVVHNQDEVLALVVDFLGVTPSALETALSYKTKLVKKEFCSLP